MKSVVTKIAESEVRKDKKGNDYKLITFKGIESEVIDLGNGQTIVAKKESRATNVNRYAKSYLPSANGAMELGYGEANGQAFLGEIVTREVETQYEIPAQGAKPARMATTFTTVVFGDSEDAGWDAKVRNAFRSKGHPVKGDLRIAAAAPKAPAVQPLVP